MALSAFDRVVQNGFVERFCPACREWKDKDNCYGKSPNGGKRELCAPCYRHSQNEKRTKRTKAACNQLIKQLVSGKAAEQIEVPHTSELASHIVKGFGGAEGLADMFVTAAKASYDTNPTSKVTLEWMKVTKDLVVKSTEQRESAPDVANLNEDELNTELTAMIGRLLDKNPELLETFAQARLMENDE